MAGDSSAGHCSETGPFANSSILKERNRYETLKIFKCRKIRGISLIGNTTHHITTGTDFAEGFMADRGDKGVMPCRV